MDVCVENLFTTPGIEAINVIQATAERNDRAASFDPHQEHRETDAGQEAVAQSPSDDLRASARPASSPGTPPAEAAAEKNPWSAWAWLGLCKNSSRKIPNIVHVDVDAFFASVEQVLNPKLRGKPMLVGPSKKRLVTGGRIERELGSLRDVHMIQTKKQNTDPVAEPETGRPAGTGEEWLGRNRSNKRRLWERLNPRSRKQIRVLAKALALQQTHANLPEPLRARLSAAVDELGRLRARIRALLVEVARRTPRGD